MRVKEGVRSGVKVGERGSEGGVHTRNQVVEGMK